MLKIHRRRLKQGGAVLTIVCSALVIGCLVIDMNFSISFIPLVISSIHIQETTMSQPPPPPPLPIPPFITNFPKISCDRSNREYDICKVNGPVTLDQTNPFFIAESSVTHISRETVRPYPRKWESSRKAFIKKVTLTTSPEVQPCQVRHDSPALVFSAGGYTGNFFHDFNDGFIPLFLTNNHVYNGSDDVILVVSDTKDWWMQKYGEILRAFSRHPVIDLDNHNASHCFTSLSVGLVSHGIMTIASQLVSNGKSSFSQFKTFLDNAYGSNAYATKELMKTMPAVKPRLVLVTRRGSSGRVILNQNELISMALEEGFEVIEFEPTRATPLKQSYDLLQSSHAFIGVHGAALTHMFFLRPGSTFLQIVPIGTNWVSKVCFGKPAKDIGLEYIGYNIVANESTLTDKYGIEHPLIKDPVGATRSWKTDVMDIYLKQQDVKLDLERFRHYLKKIYSNVLSSNITY